MWKKILFAVALSMLAFLQGCAGFEIAGPAHPERDAKSFMERYDYPPELRDAVLKKKPLTHEQVAKLSDSWSADVRFLVASNPHLAPEEIDLFIDSFDDYVREGCAKNPNLTPAQMEKLFNDRSHTAYSALGSNPSVPGEMLIRLRKERKLGLSYFDGNPSCTPEIMKELRRYGD